MIYEYILMYFTAKMETVYDLGTKMIQSAIKEKVQAGDGLFWMQFLEKSEVIFFSLKIPIFSLKISISSQNNPYFW